MSDLRVGDVCKDPGKLKAGMRIGFTQRAVNKVREEFLSHHGSCFSPTTWVCADGPGTWVRDKWIRDHGVTILAIPDVSPTVDGTGANAQPPLMVTDSHPASRGAYDDWSGILKAKYDEAEVTRAVDFINNHAAAPSLDAVPVGSRWRRSDRQWAAVYTVTSVRPGSIRNLDVAMDDGRTGGTDTEWLLAHATRIDEPAGADLSNPQQFSDADRAEAKRYAEPAGTGKVVPAGKLDPRLCGSEWREGNITYRCTRRPHGDDRHRNCSSDLVALTAEKSNTPAPAMPPARCAPGCEPSRACRIVIPVTDTGTRYECPAFAEERVKPGAMVLDHVDSQARDRYEAREMRGQRWEPATPMVGRYRFNRR